MAERSSLTFLKLGGSLITEKRCAETARLDVINRLAGEIAAAREHQPNLQLLIGHGSGSFGHVVGRRYGTRDGVTTADDWYGFAATADAAARLNRMVAAALLAAGLPAWSIQPSAVLLCRDGQIVEGPLPAVERALAGGLIPLIYGDVALDTARGGTIASTEEIFDWLAGHLRPARMILAGEVDGIYEADPLLHPSAQRIEQITPESFARIAAGVGESHGVDVTGGMAAKVRGALALVERLPGLEVVICGGLVPGHLFAALADRDRRLGTRIHAS